VFRVAKTAIELQHTGAIPGNYQPWVEKSAKCNSCCSDRKQRLHNFRLELQLQLVVPIVGRAERLFRQYLLIAVQRVCDRAPIPADDNCFRLPDREENICSAQEILDHDPSTCVAKAALGHHLIDGRSRLGGVSGNDYSFSQS
jgi:hypothetical protein